MKLLRFSFTYTSVLFIIVLASATAATVRAQSAGQAKNKDIYSTNSIHAAMERVYDWQIANPVTMNGNNNTNLWARAAFYTGIMSAYRSTGNKKYLAEATRWADSRQWKLGERSRHADDQSPGQTYLELYLLKKDPARIAATKATLDEMLSTPKPGREDWWCGAKGRDEVRARALLVGGRGS